MSTNDTMWLTELLRIFFGLCLLNISNLNRTEKNYSDNIVKAKRELLQKAYVRIVRNRNNDRMTEIASSGIIIAKIIDKLLQ